MERLVIVTVLEEIRNACNKMLFENPPRKRQLERPRHCGEVNVSLKGSSAGNLL
jgi:hypothetical protein